MQEVELSLCGARTGSLQDQLSAQSHFTLGHGLGSAVLGLQLMGISGQHPVFP